MQLTHNLLVLVGVLAFSAGAAGQPGGAVPVQKHWKGFQNAYTDKPQNLVIKTADQWKTVWTKTHAFMTPAPPMPPVDFDKQMVLAVFMGQKPSGGHAIEITKVVPAGQGLTVHVKETKPGPGDITTAVITSPYYFAVVPKVAGDVKFVTDK
jgi:hypothetical protein